MKNFIRTSICFFLLLFHISAFCQSPPPYQWAKRAGGTNNDYSYGVCTDAAGNIYTVGTFGGNATVGTFTLTGTGVDLYVAKYNSAGTVLWAKSAGPTSFKQGYAIGIDDSANTYITGYFGGTITIGTDTLVSAGSDDIYIAKLNTNGVFQWAIRAGGTSSDRAKGIAVDSAGYSYITGTFNGSAIFENDTITSVGNVDLFIAKYDPNGNLIRVKRAGGTSTDAGQNVALDPAGNSYLIGSFKTTLVIDTISLVSYGNYDMFIAKFDPAGNVVWAKNGGSTTDDLPFAVTLDGSGNVYTGGYFKGTATFSPMTLNSMYGYDSFIVKYDNLGNVRWVKREGGADPSQIASLSTEEACNSLCVKGGDLYAAGTYYSDGLFDTTHLYGFNTGTYILKFDTSGTMEWVKTGGVNESFGQGIAANNTGDCYVAGYFVGYLVHFDSLQLTNNGNPTTIYLVKVGDFTTGIHSSSIPVNDNFTVYPNPSSGIFHLQAMEGDDITIYNALGEVVYEYNALNDQMEIDLSDQPHGVYFLIRKDEKGIVSSQKLIISK